MGLPDELPARYERKTPVWVLFGWIVLLVPAFVACLLLVASTLPDAWAAALLVLAVPFVVGSLWVPIRLLVGHRVALVLDDDGLEDRTGWRARRVSWSNVKSVRLVKALYVQRISIWLREDPEWTSPSKRGASERNDWSEADVDINQAWTVLTHDDAKRLFEHYGAVGVTF